MHPWYITFAMALLLLGAPACTAASRSNTTPTASATKIPTAAAPSEEAGECGNESYPIVKGASWTYRVTGGVTGQFTRSITEVTATGFTDQDAFSTGITHIRNWQCDDETLTAIQPDEGATGPIQFYDRMNSFQTSEVDGVTITDQFIPGATWNEALLLEGTSLVNGQNVPAKDQVMLECAAGNAESIAVPAGTFNAIRANCKTAEKLTLRVGGVEQSSHLVTMSTAWYASGIGLIKSEQALANEPRITVELTVYKIP